MLTKKFSEKKMMLAGIHAIEEALLANKAFRKVFIQRDNKNPQIKKIEQICRNNNINIVFVPKEKLSRMTSVVHQGIVGLLSAVEFTDVETLVQTLFEKGINPVFAYLDRISDVRNFGAIVRSALFCGIDAVIVPMKNSADINEEALKTSAGALMNIPLCQVSNPVNFLKFLKNSGFQLVAADEKAKENLAKADFSLPTCIILGSESVGIDKNLLRYIDKQVKIDGSGQFDSLNVSVAAGIFFYEAMKNRKNE